MQDIFAISLFLFINFLLRLSRWSGEEDDYEDEPELLSTEGCFACQMNGGTRRRAGRWKFSM